MQLEGFLRSLQGNITSMALIILAIVIVCTLFSLVSRESPDLRRTIRSIGLGLTVLVIAAFTISAAVTAATNRAPRKDVDKDGVYQQMNSH